MNCLFDNGPINTPPAVQIAGLDQPLHRGETATFTATVNDSDQGADTLDIAWFMATDCETALAGAPVNCTSQRKDQCSYKPSDLGWICVAVRVTDRYGASATASRSFAIENRPPTAVIERTSPASTAATLPLSSALTFSAAKSTDLDPGETDTLTFTWVVTQPDGSSLSVNTCPAPDAPKLCSFTATMSGSYTVRLTAVDANQKASVPVSLSVTIDQDQPPCITTTEPQTSQTIAFADQATSFKVDTVADDLDPYPGSNSSGTFTWLYRIGTTGGFDRLVIPYSTYRLDVGTDFLAPAVGGVIQIRVEYQDRKNRDLSSCKPDDLRCELVPGCAQWVTWTVSVL